MGTRKKTSTTPAFVSNTREVRHDLQNSQMLALEPRIVLDAAMAASVDHSSDTGDFFSLSHHSHHSDTDSGTTDSPSDFNIPINHALPTAHGDDPLTHGEKSHTEASGLAEENPLNRIDTLGSHVTSLLFVDHRLGPVDLKETPGGESLQVILVNAETDGIKEISTLLGQAQPGQIQSIVIQPFQTEAGTMLGQSHTSVAGLLAYQETMADWGDSMASTGKIFLCSGNDTWENPHQSQNGDAATELIENITGVSTDWKPHIPFESVQETGQTDVSGHDSVFGENHSEPPARDNTQSSEHIIFIDTRLDNYTQIVEAYTGKGTLVLAQDGDSGLELISQAMETAGTVTRLQIFAHGESGSLSLGSDLLDADSMSDDFQANLTAWANALGPEADILIYGCNVAQGTDGERFMDILSGLTGADVAASTDLTGHTSLGGDWDLEATLGVIDPFPAPSPELVDHYPGILADDEPPTVANPVADVIVDEDAPNTVLDISNLFTDPDNEDGDIIKTVSLNTNGERVAATIDGNTLTLDYQDNQNGIAEITLQGMSNGQTVTDTFTVTVNAQPDAPVLTPFSRTGFEDTPLTFFSTDFTDHFNDPDTGETIESITITAIPDTGTLTLSGTPVTENQVITLDNLGNLAFSPDADWNGTTTFDWTATDSSSDSLESDTATVTLTILPDPTASDQTAALTEDDTRSFDGETFGFDSHADTFWGIRIVSLPDSNNGQLTLDGSPVSADQVISAESLGDLVFTPVNRSGNYTATFTFQARDTSGEYSAEQSYTLNVAADDEMPTVTDPVDDVIVDEDAADTGVDISNLFTDLDNDITKTVSLNTNAGLVVAAIDGNTLTLDYLDNQNGIAEITLQGTSNGQTVTDTFTVTVNAVPDAPELTAFTKSGPEDTPLPFFSTDFTDHFNDPDSGETIESITITAIPDNGILTLFGNTVINDQVITREDLDNVAFSPDANWNGTTTFEWKATDTSSDSLESDTATVTLEIAPVNDSPVLASAGTLPDITEDSATNNGISVQTFLTGHVSDVDSDSDEIGLALSSVDVGTGGTWQYQEQGQTTWNDIDPATLSVEEPLTLAATTLIRFLPADNISGTAGVTYRAWNDSADNPYSAASRTSYMSITPVNDVPVVANNTITFDETDPIQVLTAADLLVSEVSDIEEQTADQIVFNVSQTPVKGSFQRLYSGLWISLGVGSTFSQQDVLDGSIRYIYTGGELSADTTDQMSYTTRDGAGDPVAVTMNFNITDVNAPIKITGTSIGVNEYITPGDATVLNIAISDPDGDSNLITFTLNSLPDLGTLEYNNGSGFAEITSAQVSAGFTFTKADLNEGRLRYVHDGTEPSVDPVTSFLVAVTDNNDHLTPTIDSATIVLEINGVNDPPELVINTGLSLDEGASESITDANLKATDNDTAAAQLTYTITDAPDYGWLALSGNRLGTGATFQQLDIDSGSLSYVHDGSENFADTLVFDLRDGDGAVFENQSFDITITKTNDAPVIDVSTGFVFDPNDTVTTKVITTTMLLGMDEESDDAKLEFDWASLPDNVEIQVNEASATSFTQAQLAAGQVSIVYGHTAGDTTDKVITFTLHDHETDLAPLNQTVTATFTIRSSGDVGITNRGPWLDINLPLVVPEDNSGTVVHNVIDNTLLRARDEDSKDTDLTFTLTDLGGLNGALYLDGTALSVNDTFTQEAVNSGLLTYDHDGSETNGAQFSFTISDGLDSMGNTDPAADTLPKTFSIDVTAVNDPPQLEAGDDIKVDEHDDTTATPLDDNAQDLTDTENAITLTEADLYDAMAEAHLLWHDYDNTNLIQLIFQVTSAPGGGNLRMYDTDHGTWSNLDSRDQFSIQKVRDGLIAYFHDPGSEPDASIDQFSLQLFDGGDTPSETVTLTIDVTNVNDAPSASGSTLVMDEEATVTLTGDDLTFTDSDAEDTPDSLILEITELPGHGTLYNDINGDGEFDDGEEMAVGDSFTRADLTAGIIKYTHDGSENFQDLFKFKSIDADGLESSEATVNFLLRPVNDDPIIVLGDSTQHVYEGETLVITPAMLDSVDPDNTDTQQQFRITTAVEHGSLVINTDGVVKSLGIGSVFTRDDIVSGRLEYRHDNTETLADSFGFTVSDSGGGDEPSEIFSITIDPVNDSPEAVAPNGVAINEGQSVTITGLSVSDIDASENDLQLTLAVDHGTLDVTAGTGAPEITNDLSSPVTVTGTLAEINSLLANGVTYTPEEKFNDLRETDTLTLTISDLGSTGTDPADAEITHTVDTGDAVSQQASKTVSITVRPLNNAPTITYDGADFGGQTVALSVDEDNDLTLSAITVSDLDIDAGETDGTNDGLFKVTLAADHGTLSLTTTGGLTLLTGDGTQDALMVFTGARDQVDAALAHLTYLGNPDYNGPDAIRVIVSDMGNEGGGGVKTVSGTIDVTVNPVNDAPVVDNTATMALDSIDEDDTANDGNTVLEIFNRNGGDGVTDVDANAVEGMAVTGVVNTNGTWEYKISTGAWTTLPEPSGADALSDTNALLLSATDRIRFVPNGNYNGSETGSITFRAWDTTDGSAGDTGVDTTNNGGITAFSSDVETAAITVNSVNDAPVMAPGDTDLTPITEDEVASGQAIQVATLLGTTVSDVDADAVEGIAVTALDSGNGTWQFSLDGIDGSWNDIGTVSGNNALLLSPASYIRFIPDGKNETTASFEYQAWDQSSGTIGGRGDASSSGRITPYSEQVNRVSLTVTPVNDAPVLDDSSTLSLTAIQEDLALAANTGSTVADFAAAAISDVDNDSVKGIAVTGVDNTNGTWQYQLGDGDWTLIPTEASDDHALLLSLDDHIRFVPNADFNGTGSISFRAWDTTKVNEGDEVSNAGDTVNLATTGGITPYSVQTATAEITVTPVNDAPVLTVDTPSFDYADEDDHSLSITGLSVSDIDLYRGETPTVTPPVSVTLTAGTGSRLNLTLNGSTITAGALDASSLTLQGTIAQVNAALATLTYATGDDPGNSDTIAIVVNDRGNVGSGGELTDTGTVTINNITPVNDPPTSTAPASVTATEDTVFSFTDTSQLSIADADARSQDVKVSLSIPSGTLAFDADTLTDLVFQDATANESGSMVVTGSVDDINAALATLTYTPAANANNQNINEAARTLTFTVNDQGWGYNGTQVENHLETTQNVVIDIGAVNDDPGMTIDSINQQYTENEASAIKGITLSDVLDVNDSDYAASPDKPQLVIEARYGTLSLGSDPDAVNVTAAVSGHQITLTSNRTGPDALADINTAIESGYLLYRAPANYSGTDVLTLTLDDMGNSGTGTTATPTGTIDLSVTSAGQNHAPSFSGLDNTPEVHENGVPVVLDTDAVLLDPELTVYDDWGNATLTVQRTAADGNASAPTADDLFGLTGSNDSGVNFSGTTVRIDTTVVGSFTQTDGVLTIVFEEAVTTAQANGVVQAITYENSNSNPPSQVTIGFTVNDGDADPDRDTNGQGPGEALTGTGSVQVSITAANDAPSIEVPATAATTEDGDPVVLAATARLSDPELDFLADQNGNWDGAVLSLARSGDANDQDMFGVTGSGDTGVNIHSGSIRIGTDILGTVTTAGGALTITFNSNATTDQVETIARAVTYANTRQDLTQGETQEIELAWTLNDGNQGAQGQDGALDDTATQSVVLTGVNDAPVLDHSTPLELSLAEDTGAPSGPTGILVTTLLTKMTDVDATDPGGIAVTGASTDAGTWFFSTDNGDTWQPLGSPGESTARLIAEGTDDSTGRLFFQPDENFNGSVDAALTFRAWDQYTGANGSIVEVSATGGTAPFSESDATLNLTVTPVNDAPENTVPGSQIVDEDTAVEITGLGVADVDAGDGQIQVILEATHGLIVVNDSVSGGLGDTDIVGNGTSRVTLTGSMSRINATLANQGSGIQYQGDTDFSGNDTLTMTTSDLNQSGSAADDAKSDQDTIAITVTPVTDTPGLTVSPASGIEDTAIKLAITPSVTDTDNSGGQNERITQVVITEIPAGAAFANDNGDTLIPIGNSLTLTPSQLSGLTLTPPPDFNGAFDLTVTATARDGAADPSSLSRTLTVTVTEAGNIQDDTAVTAEDTPVTTNVLANDTFVGTPSVTGVTQGGHGTVTNNNDGTVTYAPDLDFSGNDSYSYTVTSGSVTETATVTVSVAPVTDTPGLTVSPASGIEDTAIKLAITPSVTDTDNSGGQNERITQVVITEIPAGAAFANDNGDTLTPIGNSLTLTPSQLSGLTLTPPPDFNGAFDLTVTATARDGKADPSSLSRTLTVTVTEAGNIQNDTAVTAEDTPVTTNVLANDTFVGTPSVTGVTQGEHGTVTNNNDGTVTYAPDLDFSGNDSYAYTVTSGSVTETATVTVSVAPVSDTPGLTVSPASGVEDTAIKLAITPSVTDTDNSGGQNERITQVVITEIPAGAAFANDNGDTLIPIGNSLTLAPDQLPGLTLTPPPDFNGAFDLTVTATARDGAADPSSLSRTLTVTVTEAGNIQNDTAVTAEDTPVTTNVLANDTFVGTPSVTGVTQGGHGTVTNNNDGTVTYAPDLDFSGNDSYAYTVTSGGITKTALVSVTVAPVSDTPGLTVSPASGVEDTAIKLAITPSVTDTDNSGGQNERITQVVITEIPAGAAFANDNGDTLIPTGNSLTLAPDQLPGLTLTPPPDFNGAFDLTVTATAQDGAADPSSLSRTLTVTVTEAGNIQDDTALTAEDTPVTTNVLANDTFVGTPSVTGVTQGGHGTVTNNNDGTVTYAPDFDFSGNDSYSYTVTSGGITKTALVSVTVAPVSDTPGLTVLPASGVEDTAIKLAITSSVTDTDNSGGQNEGITQIVITEIPAGAAFANDNGDTLTPIGNSLTLTPDQLPGLTLTPPPDFNGAFDLTVTATARDGEAQASTRSATLSVTVAASNDAPVGVNDTDIASEAGGENNASPGIDPSGNVLANDIDVDADDVKIVCAIEGGSVGGRTNGLYGTLVLGSNGNYTYTVDNDNATVQALSTNSAPLADTFTYTVQDTSGATDSARLTITILGADDSAPTSGPQFPMESVIEWEPNVGTDSSTGPMAQLAGPTEILTPVSDAVQRILQNSQTDMTDQLGPFDFNDIYASNHLSHELYLVEQVADQTMLKNRKNEFNVSVNTFFSKIDEELEYTALQFDGTPLPPWLTFEPATLTFKGTPPESSTSISVVVIAKDSKHNEAAVQFHIEIIDKKENDNTDFKTNEAEPGQTNPSSDQAGNGIKQHLTGSSEYGSFNSQVRANGTFGLIAEARELLNAMLVNS